jgi:6-phosphofructokinase 1
MSRMNFAVDRVGAPLFDAPAEQPFMVEDDQGVRQDATLRMGAAPTQTAACFEMAGPRRKLFFDPARTRVAMVTCGGLCPGINDVIRGLTMVLWNRYGVRDIWGLRYGYEGLIAEYEHEAVALTPERVEDIHQHGGTILGSSRGHQDVGQMVDGLIARGVNILFTIGGDGTQRGALALVAELRRRHVPLAVIGLPKTIDNDIAFTQRTFGFETAVAMSQAPIAGAHMEAKGVRNGIGLVKLMGRASGFVAAYASLASSDVNLALVPESPFRLEKVFAYLEQRLREKAHAVVVCAEGAGQDLVAADGTDASGNRKLGDIGVFLSHAIAQRFCGPALKATVKYIDPSYTIRSAPASADDSVFCFQLAENAVHAALSGRTGMVVGAWNDHFVHVPMAQAVAARKFIDPAGALWRSVLENTGQPFDLVG